MKKILFGVIMLITLLGCGKNYKKFWKRGFGR